MFEFFFSIDSDGRLAIFDTIQFINKENIFQQQNKNENNSESDKWSCTLILASAVCCLGSALPAGYNIGVMNNAAEVRKILQVLMLSQNYNNYTKLFSFLGNAKFL